VIDKKIQNKDGLFFVVEKDQHVIGTVIAGYDGHRGWIYSIAVHPDHQKQGIGSDLLTFTQDKLVKQIFPLRFGKYSEIKTSDFEFCFNLNGEIKLIRGLKSNWPHPAEQFKRTAGNDWVYYTVGNKSGDDGIIR
jgi:GNAT superfamily N-acetyltransferase